MPEEDHLFYSILFRCGIYKGSKIGSERKVNILLNWRPPNTDSCSPASPRSPCQFSQAWPGLRTTFNEIKRWFSQCLLHMPLDFHTACQLGGECVREKWILASLSWTMNNSREDNGATKVQLDLREPTKPWRCVLAMVSWGIQGSSYSKLSLISWQFFNLSSLGDCLLFNLVCFNLVCSINPKSFALPPFSPEHQPWIVFPPGSSHPGT